jgi:hypothetical protein
MPTENAQHHQMMYAKQSQATLAYRWSIGECPAALLAE